MFIDSEILIRQLETTYQSDEFKVLEYGPVIEVDEFSLRSSNEKFFLPFPGWAREKLCDRPGYSSSSIYRESYFRFESLSNLVCEVGLEGCLDIIQKTVETVAHDFVLERDGAKYNSKLFGLRRIRLNSRLPERGELPYFSGETYETDYFTFRVMNVVHETLVSESSSRGLRSFRGESSINSFLYPFLTSIGLNIYLLADEGKTLVLVRRGKDAARFGQDQLIYPSVNEALNATDVINVAGRGEVPSILHCLRRGLSEELGLFDQDIEDIEFMLLAVSTLGIGLGVHAVVRTRLSADSVEQIRAGPDTSIEIDSYIRVPVNKIEIARILNGGELPSHVGLGIRRLAAREGVVLDN